MRLQCENGQTIEVLHANYGRRSTSICPRFLEFKTDCIGKTSLATVKRACDGQHNCYITAANWQFGDSCWLHYKYLEVLYRCIGLKRGEMLLHQFDMSYLF